MLNKRLERINIEITSYELLTFKQPTSFGEHELNLMKQGQGGFIASIF